jgi:hypothetical protein
MTVIIWKQCWPIECLGHGLLLKVFQLISSFSMCSTLLKEILQHIAGMVSFYFILLEIVSDGKNTYMKVFEVFKFLEIFIIIIKIL